MAGVAAQSAADPRDLLRGCPRGHPAWGRATSSTGMISHSHILGRIHATRICKQTGPALHKRLLTLLPWGVAAKLVSSSAPASTKLWSRP